MPSAQIDFFGHQEQARRRTGWLVSLFFTAVVLIILAVYLAIAVVAMFGAKKAREAGAQVDFPLWNPQLFAWVAGITLVLIGGGTLIKIWALSAGGRTIARMMGGVPISPASRDPYEKRFRNVVEEMSIASGVPVPELFLLEGEEGINAFAAGFTPSDAAIAVTRGTLKYLNRDQLQGVIAHEYSHILNGDMKLNIRLMGILYGILMIGLAGQTLVRMIGRGGSGGRKGGEIKIALLLIGLAIWLIGSVGVLFGRIIKSAISRQREFLADASAVQFTRNPDGIAGALKRIGGLAQGSRLEAPRAGEASHLFFANGLGEAFLEWMQTHPPLPDRIRHLDPSFDGRWPVVKEAPVSREEEAPRRPTRIRPRAAASLPGVGLPIPPLPVASISGSPRMSIAAGDAVSRVGQVTPEEVETALVILDDIPERLKDAARDPARAPSLVFALLLDRYEAVRGRQMDALRCSRGDEAAAAATALRADVERLDPGDRLPLLDLAIPALRAMDPGAYPSFLAVVQALIEADRMVSLFEYAMLKVLRHHLDRRFGKASPPPVRFQSVVPLYPEISVLLSALAHFGNEGPTAAQTAFAKGAERLTLDPGRMALAAREACTLAALDGILEKLAASAPGVKRRILDACAHTVAADGTVTVVEAELLRAVSASLDCPMPPFPKPVGRTVS